MKKIILLTIVLMQTTFSFGQSCEQRLKTAIDGMNNFKSCSQRAEMNKLLAVATSVINECPVYYAEHQDEFLKAKKFVEDTYARLGCTNTGNTGVNNTGTNNNNNSGTNSMEQLGGIFQSGAMTITQNGLADLQSTILKEQEINKILRGNENKYPEATRYFNEYLKAKQQQKTVGNVGLGIMIAGGVATAIGLAPILKADNDGSFNEPLVYGGIAGVVGGLAITILTIKPSKKSKENLEKAQNSLSLRTTSNGVGFAFKF